MKPRKSKKTLPIMRREVDEVTGKAKDAVLALSNHRIGHVSVDLHIFDREPVILSFGVTDKKGLRDFLDQNGGVRVYRDGVRVYDYGEPGNDWLGLGGRRVNVPTRRMSNNLVIGAVNISADKSQDLLEKTNREGFVENDACRDFRDAVLCALKHIETERNIDKANIRRAYSKKHRRQPVLGELTVLRAKIEKRGLSRELGPHLDRIEDQFMKVRDLLLTPASAGLSLAVVIHEVEKGIGELEKAVEKDPSTERIKTLAVHLSELVQGLTYLTRGSGKRTEKASRLIKQALFNTNYRLKYHKIIAVNGLENGGGDFSMKCMRRLIIATLMNLIDNSIWWLDNQVDSSGQRISRRKKRIYLGTTRDIQGGPAIVVADNGPGFIDAPEYLVQPFLSRKPDGMGLGLHLADEVMKANGGRLEFPEEGAIALPKGFDGAVVALVFGEDK